MHGESRVATVAACNVATSRANQRRREASPVQEDQYLAIGLKMASDRVSQRFAETVTDWCAGGIDQSHGWWFCAAGPAGQMNVLVVAVAAVLQHFQRWRCGAKYRRNIQLLGPDDSEVSC